MQIYHGELSDDEHEHIQQTSLELVITHTTWRTEDFRDCLDIWETRHVSYGLSAYLDDNISTDGDNISTNGLVGNQDHPIRAAGCPRWVLNDLVMC